MRELCTTRPSQRGVALEWESRSGCGSRRDWVSGGRSLPRSSGEGDERQASPTQPAAWAVGSERVRGCGWGGGTGARSQVECWRQL